MKKIIIPILIIIFLIANVNALLITEIDTNAVYGFITTENEKVVYSNGTHIKVIDKNGNNLGNLQTTKANNIIINGILSQDNPENIFYITSHPHNFVTIYLNNLSISQFNISSYITMGDDFEIVAVLPQYIVISSTVGTSNRAIVLNRTTLSLIYNQTLTGTFSYNNYSGFVYPQLSNRVTGGYAKYQTNPVYIDEKTFFIMAGNSFSTLKYYNNFLHINNSKIYGYVNNIVNIYNTSKKLTYKNMTGNLQNQISTNDYGRLLYSKEALQRPSDSVDEGEDIKAVSLFANINANPQFPLYYGNNGYSQFINEDYAGMVHRKDLFNHRIFIQDKNNIFYDNNEVRIIDIGIITIKYAQLNYLNFVGKNIVFVDSTNKLKLITEILDENALPSISVYGQLETVDTVEAYEIAETKDILYKETTTEKIYDTQDFENITYNNAFRKFFGNPYYNILPSNQLNKQIYYTEFERNNFIIKYNDFSGNFVNIAYDCDYLENQNIIYASDDLLLYTDEAYNYNGSETGNLLIDELQLEDKQIRYIRYNTNIEPIKIDKVINLNNKQEMTFNQYIRMDLYSSISHKLYNIYENEIINLLIENKEYDGNFYTEITINGNMVYNDTIISLDDHIILNYYIKENELTYIIKQELKNIVNGKITLTNTAPIRRIEFIGNEPTETTIGKVYVYFGEWQLIEGNIFPEYNQGFTKEYFYQNRTPTYYYKSFVCEYPEITGQKTYNIRVYYNNKNTYEYEIYDDYFVFYDSAYIDIQRNLIDNPEGTITEKEKTIYATDDSINNKVCTLLKICDENGRLLFSIIMLIIFTGGTALFMKRNYEETRGAYIIVGAVYSTIFVLFAVTGWLPTWYIILNLVIIAGIIASSTMNRGTGGQGL